jgi:hypothetical protein
MQDDDTTAEPGLSIGRMKVGKVRDAQDGSCHDR